MGRAVDVGGGCLDIFILLIVLLLFLPLSRRHLNIFSCCYFFFQFDYSCIPYLISYKTGFSSPYNDYIYIISESYEILL